MVRGRSVFQAASLLARSGNKDITKWTDILKGLHRKAVSPSITDSTYQPDHSVCSSREVCLVFEAFSKIYKNKELINTDLIQKLAIPSENPTLSGNKSPSYRTCTFNFFDLVNLYLPLTNKCIETLDLKGMYKLLTHLSIIKQEYYFIINNHIQLAEKFATELNGLSTDQIINLIKICIPSAKQIDTAPELLSPLLDSLHKNIMLLTTIQIYKLVEALHYMSNIPNPQILYDSFIRLREEYIKFNLTQIVHVLLSYTRHLEHTYTFIRGFLNQISDYLVKKCGIHNNHVLDAKILTNLLKCYSSANHVDIKLFDAIFTSHIVWRNLSLDDFSLVSTELQLLQSNQNVYIFQKYPLESEDTEHISTVLQETYPNGHSKVFNPLRQWLTVKHTIFESDTEKLAIYDKHDKKHRRNALILTEYKNYHGDFARWWQSFLSHLSTCVKDRSSTPDIDLASSSIKILESMVECGQYHPLVLNHLINLIESQLDSLSRTTILGLICYMEIFNLDYSKILNALVSRGVNKFGRLESLALLNLLLINKIEPPADLLKKVLKTNKTIGVESSLLYETLYYLKFEYTNPEHTDSIVSKIPTAGAEHYYPWLMELLQGKVQKLALKHSSSEMNRGGLLIYSRLRFNASIDSLQEYNRDWIELDFIDDKRGVEPYHWQLESFKQSRDILQDELSKHNIQWKSMFFINSCPVDIIAFPLKDKRQAVIACLAPSEFDWYTNTCYWKSRFKYLSLLVYECKLVHPENILQLIEDLVD